MPTEIKWEAPESIQTYLTTELNSLGDGANKLGGEIANETDKERFINIEVYVATQGSARSSNACIEVYCLSTHDGTNFNYGDDSTDPPASALIATLPLDAATTARYVTIENVEIPPLDLKLLFINETGEDFASSGNTVKYRRHSHESQ